MQLGLLRHNILIMFYGRFVYYLYKCLVLSKSGIHEYDCNKSRSSVIAKIYNKMAIATYAEKIFDYLVSFVDEETKYSYTIVVNYANCKLLIRPFLFHDIIMATDQWEREVKNVIYSKIKKNDVVIDIGAYIGDYTIPLAKHAYKVIAFEPNLQTAGILEKNIHLNQAKNIKLFTKVVGKTKSKVKFYMSQKPLYSGVFNSPPVTAVLRREGNIDKDSTAEVETVDLDSMLINEKRIDWLLIDAEGYEVNVLNGATCTLRKHSPKIIIEIQPENRESVNKILIDKGYSITRLNFLVFYARKQL
jgi:FkbM family methyltransferase